MATRSTALLLGLLIAAAGLGLVRPMPARAGDTEKVIAALAVGGLVYGLIDAYEDRGRCQERERCYGRPEYYRPPSCARERRAYEHGYNEGFSDGYRWGYRDGSREGYRWGYREGYREGRWDEWTGSPWRTVPYTRPMPIVVAPWPWF
jgi:hypothetical protein